MRAAAREVRLIRSEQWRVHLAQSIRRPFPHTAMLRALRLAAPRSARTHATHVDANASERWSRAAVRDIYHAPLLDLVFRAGSVHRQHQDPSKVQLCTLMNIKSARPSVASFIVSLSCAT